MIINKTSIPLTYATYFFKVNMPKGVGNKGKGIAKKETDDQSTAEKETEEICGHNTSCPRVQNSSRL